MVAVQQELSRRRQEDDSEEQEEVKEFTDIRGQVKVNPYLVRSTTYCAGCPGCVVGILEAIPAGGPWLEARPEGDFFGHDARLP